MKVDGGVGWELDTAATVMPRRGVACDDDVQAWLGAVWDETRG